MARTEIEKMKRENEQLKQAQPGLARSPSKSVAPERRRRRSTGSARRRESGAEIEKSKLGRQRRRSTGRTNRTKEEEEAMLERREKRRQDRLRLRRYVGVLSLTVEMRSLNLVLFSPLLPSLSNLDTFSYT